MPDSPFAGIDISDIVNSPQPDLKDIYHSVAAGNPDKSAEVLNLSRRTQQQPEFVDAHLDDAKQAAAVPSDHLFADIEKNHPIAARFLSDPQNMAVAHDDIPNVVAHEGLVKATGNALKYIAKQAELGGLQEEQAFQQARKIPFNIIGTDPISSSFRAGPYVSAALGIQGISGINPDERLKQLDAKIKEIQTELPQVGAVPKAIGGAANLAPLFAGSAGYGVAYGAAGSEVPILGNIVTGAAGVATYNLQYSIGAIRQALSEVKDEKGQPLSEDAVNAFAVGGGLLATAGTAAAVKTGLGSFPAGRALLEKFAGEVGPKVLEDSKAFKQAFGKFLIKQLPSNALKGALGMTEFAGVQKATEETAKATSGQPFKYDIKGDVADLGKTFGSSLATFGIIGLAGAPFEARAKWQESKQVETEQSFYKAMGATAEASKLRQRLPEAYQEHIKELTNGTPVEAVHVPVAAWDRYFQSANIDPGRASDELGVTNAYAEAKATGNDVKVPMDTWVSKLVGTKHYEGLAGDVKFDQDGLTHNQIKERNDAIREKIQVEQAEAEKQIKADPATKAGHDEIIEDVKAQLLASGYLADDKNREKRIEDNAKVVAQRYVTSAIRRNIPVEQLYRQDRATIMGQSDLPPLTPQTSVALHLIHHGTTDIDAADQTHGKKDPSLNEQGRKDVEAAKTKLPVKDLSRVVSGDTKRAQETAKIIHPDAKIDPRFNPIDIGDLGGMPVAEFKPKYEMALQDWTQHPERKILGKESFADFQKRQIEAIQDVIGKAKPGDQVGLALNSDSIQYFKLLAENNGMPLAGETVKRMAEKEALQPGTISTLLVDPSTGRIEAVGRPSSQSTEPNLLAQAGKGGGNLERDQSLFPVKMDSLPPTITGHPDFVKITNDAAAVVRKYAKERGIEPTAQFAEALHSELHDAFGEVRTAPLEKRLEVYKKITAKYPDIDAEWIALRNKMQSDVEEAYFNKAVAGQYGPIRPKAALDAEKEQGPLEQSKRGEYYPVQNVIRLMKGADASTFLHESAHQWLQSDFAFSKSGNAPQEFLDHWKDAKDWLGIQDQQTDLTREQQEKFANGFEQYLMEGKAPAEGLRGIFNRFRRWLTQVYRGAQQAQLSPEIKGFMDRLLATDDEIARAASTVGYQPSEIQNVEGLDPAAQKRHRTLQERARDQAEAALLKDQMDEFSSENKAAFEAERSRQEARARAAAAQEPVYSAMQDLEENRPKGAGTFRAETMADRIISNTTTDEERALFEAVAEENGFADGKDLAHKIAAAKPFEEEVKGRTEQAMLPFADLRNRDAIRENAMEAIHQTKQSELLALEHQMLSDLTRQKEIGQEATKRNRAEAKVEADAAKRQAHDLLESKPWKEAQAFRQYFTAEKNAAMRVSGALAKGDFEAAAAAKQQQLLNHALAAEALRNKKEVEKNFAYLDKFAKRGKDLMDMPFGFVNQIDGLLADRGLAAPRNADKATMGQIADEMERKGSESSTIANSTGLVRGNDGKWRNETLTEFANRVNENYYAINLPDSVMPQGPYSQRRPEMSLGDLRDLRNAVQTIANAGKLHDRFLSDFIKGDLRSNAAELRKKIEENIGKPHEQETLLGETDFGRVDKAVKAIKNIPDGMISSKVNLLTLSEYLDRLDPNGPAKNNVYRPLREAENAEKTMRRDKAAELDAIRNKHYTKDEMAKMGDENFATWTIDTKKGKKQARLTRENAIVLLLNRGSESNLDRVTNGFGISSEDVAAITDKLSPKDHEFVKDVWKFVDSFWPQVKALEMKVNGVEPKKVEATPFETPYGTMPGGYYPLAYDFEKSADAYKNAEERNALYKQYSTAAAHTDQGHLKNRVNSLSRPVRLTFDGLFNHLDDVIHDLSYRPAIIDVARFLNQPDAKESIVNAIGIDGYKKIGEDLKAAGSSQAEFLTGADKTARWFRFGSTFATLGYRIAIFPRRISEDVVNSMREVGFRETLGKVGDYILSPKDTQEFVRGKSAVMQDRAISRERDLMEMSKQWKGQDSIIRRYAFMQDTLADQFMSYPVWTAVYKKNVAQFGEERARQMADESVIKTFGSGSVLERVGAQRGGELNKMLSMYYSWHSMMFNRAWLSGKISGLEYNEGNYGKALAIIAGTTATSWVIPAAIDIFWSEYLRNVVGGKENEDKEAKGKRMASRALEAPFAMFPMGRNVAAFAIPRLLGEKGQSYHMAPVEAALENIIDTTAQGANRLFNPDKQYDEKFMENLGRSAAVLLRVPQQLMTWVFNFKDWLDGEGEATWRDLVTRRKKK